MNAVTQLTQLTSGGYADEKLATGGEQLFGNEYGEGCTDRTTDQPEIGTILGKSVELGVVASPIRVEL